MTYTLIMSTDSGRKLQEFKESDPVGAKALKKAIDGLAANPKPPGCHDYKDGKHFRIEPGKYKVFYEVEDAKITVTVLSLGRTS